METIKIKVYISQKAALAHSLTSYGASVYAPTQEQLLSLTEGERERVSYYLEGTTSPTGGLTGSLDLSAPVSWDEIHRALAHEVERRRVKREALLVKPALSGWEICDFPGDGALTAKVEEVEREKRTRERKDQLERILAWDPAGPHSLSPLGLSNCYDEVRAIQEVQDRYAHQDRRDREKKRVAEEAAKAEWVWEEAKKAAALAALKAYVLKSGSTYAEALAQGYDCASAILTETAERVTQEIGNGAFLLVEGSEDHDSASWEEREAPTNGVILKRGEIVSAVAALAQDLPGEVFTVLASKVMRFKDEEEGDFCTVTVVTLKSPLGGDRCIIVPLE